jgi:hypothetical protein
MMNKKLQEAIARVEALPDDRQDQSADVLLAFLDTHLADIHLSPEQIAQIERRMSDEEPFASDKEVQSLFARLTE